ncbi:KH domain-containing protein [Candidatus Dependentiae bacterium]|nr:KH domain-containing protein [Candidatus Dependentiae bacterium]
MFIQLIEHFIVKLVEKPEAIVISEVETAGKSIIEIRVAAQDIAKVIGKEGRTFKALRSLIHCVDPEARKDIVVDIVT